MTNEKIKFINGWMADYDNGVLERGDGILLYRKDGKIFQRVIRNLADNFYFYIEKKKFKKFPYPLEDAGNYFKVSVPKYGKKDEKFLELIKLLNDHNIKHYEADLTPLKRYCIDNNIEVEDFDKMKQLFFDIETKSTVDIKDFEHQRILSFAGVDQDGKEYFLREENEKELLIKIDKLIKKFDILIGWNSGGYFKYGEAQGFDIPCLMARFKKHKISTSYLYHILKEDLMYRIKSSYSLNANVRGALTNFSLDYISRYFLGRGKTDLGGKMPDYYYNRDPDLFKRYNLEDARLVYELEKKTGVINLTMKINQWCGVIGQPYSPLPSLDSFILAEGNKNKVHFKTNEHYMFDGHFSGDDSKIAGGFVMEVKKGIYDRVVTLDFASMYPNIMRTFNISPDTLTNDKKNVIITPNGAKFTKEFIGIIPKKITELLDMRNKFKKEMELMDKNSLEYSEMDTKQWVTKIISNSLYGVMAQPVSRYFKKELAEAITLTGQWLIKESIKYVESKGMIVVQSDTDSLMLALQDESQRELFKEINEYINNKIKEVFGISESYLNIRPDKSFDKFISVEKKRYAGIKDGKLIITGLEAIKRDTVKITRDLQIKLLEKILNGANEKEILNFFIKEKKNVLGAKEYSPKDICINIYIQKDLSSYGPKKDLKRKYTKPIHIRIAEKSKKKINAGNYFSYVLTSNNPLDGVPLEEYKGNWCREYYWANRIAPALVRIINIVYPNLSIDKYI